MANRRIIVSYGRTIQDKPFHSIHLGITIEKDILDEDNVKDQIDKTVNGLSKYIHAKVTENAKRQNEKDKGDKKS